MKSTIQFLRNLLNLNTRSVRIRLDGRKLDRVVLLREWIFVISDNNYNAGGVQQMFFCQKKI